MKKPPFLLFIMLLLSSFVSVIAINTLRAEASIHSPNVVTKELVLNLHYTDSGWYTDGGAHTLGNANYLVGKCGTLYCSDNTTIFRNFFVFDLAFVPGTILTATLVAENPDSGFESNQSSETWTIYEVSTPIDTLVNSTSSVAIYDDLGSGMVFGSTQITADDNGELVTVALNNDALSELNSAIGQKFAVGGAITTLEDNDQVEWAFANTNDASFVRRLVVTIEIEASDFVFVPFMIRD